MDNERRNSKRFVILTTAEVRETVGGNCLRGARELQLTPPSRTDTGRQLH